MAKKPPMNSGLITLKDVCFTFFIYSPGEELKCALLYHVHRLRYSSVAPNYNVVVTFLFDLMEM